MTLTDTKVAIGSGAELDVQTLAYPDEIQDEIFYRDTDTAGQWELVRSRREAEDLVRSRTLHSPWVTITRTYDEKASGDLVWKAIEVLGTPDGLFICGDVRRNGIAWFWSAWPAGWEHMDKELTTTIGPPWYRGEIYDIQKMTDSDAVVQVWPALHAQLGVANQVPGYVWRDRRFDHDQLHHLRQPITP